MIRVLHFTTDSKIAGAEKLLIGIAKEFDASKFQVYFCTLKEKGDLHKELEKYGCEAFSLKCSNFMSLPLAYFRLLKIIKARKIDVLHTHLYHASVLGQLVAFFYGKVFNITTRHYSDLLYIYGTSFQRALDKLSMRIAKQIISISLGVKKVLVELDKIDPKKITVVYNGIDFSEFNVCNGHSSQIRKEFSIDDGVKLIGAVGSLHPRKGHWYLIEAADILCRRRNDIKFIIVGDGILRQKLIALRDAFGLKDKIIFTGYRKDIVNLVCAMDIVVQPSVEEGFGLSIIEAMVLGKPIIATKVGGIPEIINDKETGLLVNAKNPVSLAESLDFLLNCPAERELIGAQAAILVKQKFNLINMIKSYENIYERRFNR